MIRAQGGDPEATLPVASCRDEVLSVEDGIVHSIDALDVGTRRGASAPDVRERRIR